MTDSSTARRIAQALRSSPGNLFPTTGSDSSESCLKISFANLKQPKSSKRSKLEWPANALLQRVSDFAQRDFGDRLLLAQCWPQGRCEQSFEAGSLPGFNVIVWRASLPGAISSTPGGLASASGASNFAGPPAPLTVRCPITVFRRS